MILQNNDDTTAIPYYQYRLIDYCTWVREPICRCFVAEPNTAATIYCPLHGLMYKGRIIEPVKMVTHR